MENQADESPRLVILRLDNGELAEDLTQRDGTASEVLESHGLPDGLAGLDPSDTSPGALPRQARHPSTDQRIHPAQIEEDI